MKPMPFLTAIVLVLMFTISARAQDEGGTPSREIPRVQIAGGYSFVQNLGFDQSIPGGWFISADRNVSERLSITLDLSASGTVVHHLAFLPGHVTHWSTGGLMLGPTLSNRENGRLVVFSRLLGGIATAGSDDGSGAALGIQPGVGFDYNFSRHLGMRATADYRWLAGIGTASGESASQVWLRTGLVVSFGAR